MSDEMDTPTPSPAPGAPTPPRASGEIPAEPSTVAQSFTKELRDGRLDKPMPFAEFMLKLGMAYDLPGRREELEAQSLARKRRTRRWLVALAVVTVISGLVAPRFTRTPSEPTLPIDVLGQWRTLYPQYAGRAFTLAQDRIELDFGALAARVTFPISEVRRNTVADTSVFEILYRQDRGLTRFEFIYVEGAVPMVYLPNPRGVAWVRIQDLPLVGPTGGAVAVPEAAVETDAEGVTRRP